MKDFLHELSSWSCILVPLALVISGFVIALLIKDQNRKDMDSKKEQQRKCMEEKGITRSLEYEWRNAFNTRYYRYIVDNVHRKIYIDSDRSNNLREIPFSEIIDFEVFYDAKPAETLKRAVMGGAIYGPMGAFIGARTAKDKIQSYTAVIYTNNVNNPRYELKMIQTATSTSSQDYSSAVRFASNVKASIISIVSSNHTYRESSPDKGYVPTIEELIQRLEDIKKM